MSATPPQSVSIVTVTYSDRLEFLEQVVSNCFEDPAVADIYIVSNNSSSNLGTLTDRWGDRVKLIELDRNYGSALGYAKGIDAAVAGGLPYIMLLDDDNSPSKGCIDVLYRELKALTARLGAEKAAVATPRDYHVPEVLAGMAPEVLYPRPSSFMGFNLFHKLVRLKLKRVLGLGQIPEGSTSVRVPYGPYGGMMASRHLYQSIGLPMESLILYSDDIEYTYRIAKSGGELRLVFDARVEDLDGRHSISIEENSVFLRILKSPSHFRLYYIIRNQIWFEAHRCVGNRFSYKLNRAIFLFFMRRAADRIGRPKSFEIFLEAVCDGEAGALGIHKEFPLP